MNPRNVTDEPDMAANRVSSPVALPSGCPACLDREDAGNATYRPHVLIVRHSMESLGRCSCARGQELRKADLRREEEQRQRMATKSSVL